MTDEQTQAVARWRHKYDAIGWKVTVIEEDAYVVLSAYGGPRAFHAVIVKPDGSTGSVVMA